MASANWRASYPFNQILVEPAPGLPEVGLFSTAELQAIERENAAELMPRYKA